MARFLESRKLCWKFTSLEMQSLFLSFTEKIIQKNESVSHIEEILFTTIRKINLINDLGATYKAGPYMTAPHPPIDAIIVL
jgi:hypothetical protein